MVFFRIIFSVLLLIVVVCVVAIGSLVLFIDPNKLKPVIIAEVMQKTGYQLLIDSQMSWSFYPKLGISAAHMQLKKPEQTETFVDLYDVSIATDLLQLLKGNKQLQGDVYIQKIKYLNVNAERAHVGLKWQNQILTLQPFTASLYDGKIQGVIHGRELSAIPAWNWVIELNQVQVKPLLQDLYGTQNKLNLSGAGQVQMQGETRGVTRNQILSNLNGYTHFTLREGVLDGVDLNYFVESADALLSKQPVSLLVNTNKTVFESLVGSATIKNGIADTNDLFLISSSFSTKVIGRFDLVNQVINFQLQIVPVHAAKLKWTIPLLLSGDLHHPEVGLDMVKLQTMITQDKLDKIKLKVKDKVKELPDKVDKFLKKLMSE